MKRTATPILVTLMGCGSFDATPSTGASNDLDGGGGGQRDVATVAKADGSGSSQEAGPPRVCTLLVKADFNTADISGWQPPRKTGQVVVAIGNVKTAAGEDSMALGTEAYANPGSGVASEAYLERLAVTTTTVAQLEYDLLYTALEGNALVGCTLGPRQGVELEPRIGLEQRPDGLSVTGSLQTQLSSLPAGDATVIVTPPPGQHMGPRA